MKLAMKLEAANLANLGSFANLANLVAAHKNRRHAANLANLANPWGANPRILGQENGESGESLAPRASKCTRPAQESFCESRCESTPPHGESSKSRKTRNAPRCESTAISAEIRAPKKSAESFEGFARQDLKIPTRHAMSALHAAPPHAKANPSTVISPSRTANLANLFCESHANAVNLAANPPHRVANPLKSRESRNAPRESLGWDFCLGGSKIRRRAKSCESGESCESFFAQTPRISRADSPQNPSESQIKAANLAANPAKN